MSLQALTRLFGVPLFLTIPPTAIVVALFYFSVFGNYREIAVADGLYLLLRWPLGGIYLWAISWAAFNLWRLRRWRKGLLIGGCQNCKGPTTRLEGGGGAYKECLICSASYRT